MSRSRRHEPLHGWTCSESEKSDKRRHNRLMRRTVNQQLPVIDDDIELSQPEELDNVYSWDKDGKMRFDPAKYPELMRK